MTTTTPDSAHQKQVAVNDIGTSEDFLAAVDETIKYFNDGDIVEGTVVKVDRDEVLVDIGYKTEGVILSRELSIKHDVDPSEVVEVGDGIEALVLTKEDKDGRLMLSKKRAQYERAWGDIERIKDEDGVVTGTVIEVVKGGLIVDIGLRGFLPASLVEMRRVRDLAPYIGQQVEAKIIELDKNRNNVVLSRRAWLEQTQSAVRHDFLQTLQKGQVRPGVVSSIVNFGAFVDLGGVDGLVHVSELSWKHIEHPSEVVTVGDEVTVEVLDVDMDRERVSLSLKATQEDPWQHFARTHIIGQIVPGKVTKLVPFGAFVRVEDGIEGLVHVSELSWKHIEHASDVVEVGQEVTVEVLSVELDRERVSLSLKATQEDPWQVFARTHAIGQIAPGVVTKLVPFGAFVRVADGIEGLVHISELSGQHVELAEQVVQAGQEVFVKIIDIDLDRRRISLSLKQANEGVDPEGTEFDPALYGMTTDSGPVWCMSSLSDARKSPFKKLTANDERFALAA
jgi:small subunit ribosomal protein S1